MFETAQLKRIIEAALLASSHPLSIAQIAGLFDELDMPSHEQLARAVADLRDDAAGRGVELVEVASGFRYQVRGDVHPHVARLWAERPSRYSRALLETLCLIAYRQPITRGEIEQIRGVAVSSHIIRTLEEREWVRVVGYRDLPGKPALLGTTRQFLDYFGLVSLDQLPPLADIQSMDEGDPQLAFGEPPLAVFAAVDATAGRDDESDAGAAASDESTPEECSLPASAQAPADEAVDPTDDGDVIAPDRAAEPSSTPSAEPEPGDARSRSTEPVA